MRSDGDRGRPAGDLLGVRGAQREAAAMEGEGWAGATSATRDVALVEGVGSPGLPHRNNSE